MRNINQSRHLRFRQAASESEVDAALALAVTVFQRLSPSKNCASDKTVFWKRDPSHRPSNVLLAWDADDEVAGVIRLVPRKLTRGDEVYDTAGISSVCLRPDIRGQGHSVPFMEFALDTCRQRGHELALLFARRALDGYYTKFGFWGVSSYSKVNFRSVGTMRGDHQSFEFIESNPDLFGVHNDAYEYGYRHVFGRTIRDRPYWNFLMEKCSRIQSTVWRTILHDRQPVGYLIASGTTIHEVAYLPGTPAVDLVSAIAYSLNALTENVIFEITPQHALIRDTEGTDTQVTLRECHYGGHMLRVLDPHRAADKLCARLQREARRLGIDEYAEERDGWGVECRHERCALRGKLPQVVDYPTTATLLGLYTPRQAGFRLDETLPFRVGLLDEL